MKYLFYLVFASLLISSSCNDNPVIIKDPCEGAKPFKADFTVYEQLWYDSAFVAIDTVIVYNIIHFKANEDYDTYNWIVGEDTTHFYSKEVLIKFKEPLNRIPVRLIATKAANMCFPNDKTIDTIIKYITIVPWKNSALTGNFRGVSTYNLKDTFNISIYFKGIYENGTLIGESYLIVNFDHGCQGFVNLIGNREVPLIKIKIGYRTLKIDGDGTNYYGCNDPLGYAQLSNENQTITINYTLKRNQNNVYKFIGTRVQ